MAEHVGGLEAWDQEPCLCGLWLVWGGMGRWEVGSWAAQAFSMLLLFPGLLVVVAL